MTASYFNHNGIGDRRSTITITTSPANLFLNRDDGTSASSSGALGNILPMLVDGYPTPTVNVNPALPAPPYPFSLAINPATTAGDWIKFHFDVAENIVKFFSKGSADWNGGVGVWQWYGSNDDSTYTAVGSSFTWNNDENDFPENSPATYYLYWKLQMVSGTVSGTGYTDAPIQTEFEFYINYSGEATVTGTDYNNLFGSDHREPQAVVVTSNQSNSDYAGYIGNLVSGSTGGSDTNNAIIFIHGGVTSNGKSIQFQFPRPVIIDELKLYQSGNFDEGDFDVDVSNNGSTWTNLTSFTWNTTTQIVPTGNRTEKFAYLRINGTNAAKNWSVFPWLFEVQFKINGNGPIEIGNRTSLITVTTTATVNTGTIANIVNGDESATDVTWNDSNIAGKDVTFDFGATSVVISGIQLLIANNSSNYGVWQPQYWDGASWNNIGSTITIGGNSTVTGGGIPFAEMHTWSNTNSGTKFRLLGVSGTNNDGGNSWNEVNLMIADPSTDRLEATEAPDVFHAVGYPGFPGTHGSLITTEAPDTAHFVGLIAAVGSLIATEAPDIFHGYMKQPLTGHLAATEAPDRFHGTGIGRGEDGVLIATEAPDVFHGTGKVPVVAVMHATEAPDRFRALGAGAHRVRRRRSISVT